VFDVSKATMRTLSLQAEFQAAAEAVRSGTTTKSIPNEEKLAVYGKSFVELLCALAIVWSVAAATLQQPNSAFAALFKQATVGDVDVARSVSLCMR
jgi:hypothetical protein